MDNRLSRLVLGAVCAAALLAVPFASSCSSFVSLFPSPFGSPSSSSSSAAEETYYLGVDEEGYLALYKGEPGNGASPVRTTDIDVADLHESVAAGLKEGIKFDSFNEAIERIGDYREAAKAAAEAREAEALTPEQEAAQAAQAEADQLEAAAAEQAAAEQAAAEQAVDQAPAPAAQAPAAPAAEPAPQVASDEYAAPGEFWGVWLNEYIDLGAAYEAADVAQSQGFASEVFEVTNNTGTVYVVGAGEFATKTEAQAVLAHARELGYASAYLHTAAKLQ